jgi:hypothetical protein
MALIHPVKKPVSYIPHHGKRLEITKRAEQAAKGA